MKTCDHVTLQRKRPPTDSGIHTRSGCCPSPATLSRLHSCELTHGLADTTYTCPAIRRSSAPPPGTVGWQDSASQGQKCVRDWGNGEGEEGQHHGLRLGDRVDVPCRAPCSSERRRRLPPLCLGTALPTHSPPRVYLPPGCCPVDPLDVVPLCDLGLAGHMAIDTWSPRSDWSAQSNPDIPGSASLQSRLQGKHRNTD